MLSLFPLEAGDAFTIYQLKTNAQMKFQLSISSPGLLLKYNTFKESFSNRFLKKTLSCWSLKFVLYFYNNFWLIYKFTKKNVYTDFLPLVHLILTITLKHLKLEHLLEWKGLEWSESNTLQTSVVLEAPEAGGGVNGVLGEFGADAVLSVSLSGILL